MEQISFLSDFPATDEEKLYKSIGSDETGDYNIFTGGTYVCVKNKKGLAVRFTSSDIKGNDITPTQMEAWLKRLHQLHPNF